MSEPKPTLVYGIVGPRGTLVWARKLAVFALGIAVAVLKLAIAFGTFAGLMWLFVWWYLR